MSRIVTLGEARPELSSASVYAARFWKADLHGPFPADLTERLDSGVDVEARVDHSRWIVDCPTDGCNAAYYFNDDDLRFWCVYCNTGWHRIVLPARRARIEALLLARPSPATRNWRPGETIADLEDENAEHGVGD